MDLVNNGIRRASGPSDFSPNLTSQFRPLPNRSQAGGISPQEARQLGQEGLESSRQLGKEMEEIVRPQPAPPNPSTSPTSSGDSVRRAAASPASSGGSESGGGVAGEGGGGSAPASNPSPTDPLLSRAALHFDRSQVATSSDSLGETRGITQNELVLDRSNAGQAQQFVEHELGRQSQAADESQRRASHAESSLDTARGRENQLNQQRQQLEATKSVQRSNADETKNLLESGQQQLTQQQGIVERTQAAGETSLSRINQLDAQTEQQAQIRNQASNDAASSQQTMRSLQTQISSLQKEPPKQPPGQSDKGKGPGKSEEQQQKAQAEAVRQSALSTAQSQLEAARNSEQQARQRQEQAQASIQASQTSAARERQALDRSRAQLDKAVQNRTAAQARAQQHKGQLREDLDRVGELSSHSQDINAQFDEVGQAKDRALVSLERNRSNGEAANQNVLQLRTLAQDESRQRSQTPSGQDPEAPGQDRRPERTISRGEREMEFMGGQIGPSQRTPSSGSKEQGPSVLQQGDKTVVRLQALNQGMNASSADTSAGASRRRSGVEAADDLGKASLAAAAAASNPSESSPSSSTSLPGSAGKGKSKDFDDDGPGKGRGRGRGPF